MAAKKENPLSYYGTGRRKTSVARVRLFPGTGKIMVNGIDVNEYMPYEVLVRDLKQPLVLTQCEGKFDVIAMLMVEVLPGQAGAIRLGIARALLEASNNDFRPILKSNGMLTRDSRKKERKKYGLKKARKSPQFSKR